MARDRQLGNLSVRLRADITQYLSMMEKAGAATEKTQSQMAISAEKMTTVFAGATTAIVGFATASIKAAIDWGKAIEDLSDKTGMSGEESSKFLVLAKRTGMDMEKAQIIWGKFSKAVYASADAMGKAAAEGKASDDVLTRLGIAAQNTDGSMRSTLEVFTDVKNRLQQMENGWQKTSLELELFGKSGTDVHDVLMMSNEEMTKTIDRAQKLGLIMSSDVSAAWKQLDLNMNEAKGTLTSIGIGIGNELLPKMTESLQKVQDLTAAFIAWKAANPALAESIGEVAVALGKVVMAAKALQLVGLKSPWIIPILAFGAAVDYAANRNPMETSAGREAAKYGFSLDEPNPVGMGGLRTAESKVITGNKKPSADEFLGGKGGGGSGKTALEELLAAHRQELQIIEMKRELGKVTYEEYYEMLIRQRDEIVAVTATEKDRLDQQIALLNIQVKIYNEDKKNRDEAFKERQKVMEWDAQNQTKKIQDAIDAEAKTYQSEMEIMELRKGSRKEYLAWLLAESKKFNANKDQMDQEQYLREVTREYMRQEAIKKTNEEIAKDSIRAANSTKEAWADALTDVVTGNREAADVLKQVWQELVNNLIRQLFGLESKAGGLLGGIFGNSSGGGNWLSSIFGGVFGGGSSGALTSLAGSSSSGSIAGLFADGGVPPVNRMSIVGEAGPELFVPGRTGRVVSNDELSGLSGGKGDVYINPTFQSLDPATNMKLFKEQLPMIKSEIRAAMVNEPSMRTAVRSAAK